MAEAQVTQKPHMVVIMEIMDYRHFAGKGETPRPSTMVSGVMTLPEGRRTIVEFFMDGTHHLNEREYRFGLRIGSDWKKRLSVSVIGYEAVKA